jgi:hypothetical protein
MVDDKPPQSIPRPSEPSLKDLLTTLTMSVEEGFRELKGDFEVMHGDVKGLHGRMTSVETRVSVIENRGITSSDRVRAIARGVSSEADLAQQAALADEIVARKSLAEKVDALDQKQDAQLSILRRLDAVVKNPTVGRIASAVGTAILIWLANHYGIR